MLCKVRCNPNYIPLTSKQMAPRGHAHTLFYLLFTFRGSMYIYPSCCSESSNVKGLTFPLRASNAVITVDPVSDYTHIVRLRTKDGTNFNLF